MSILQKGDTQQEYTEIYSWGYDEDGQMGLGENRRATKVCLPRICSFSIVVDQVSCGFNHSAFVAKSGYLYTMGSNAFGKLGIGESEVKNSFSPQLVSSLTKYKVNKVSCGYSHTATIIDTGELLTWGDNSNGQTGIEGIQNSSQPKLVNFSKCEQLKDNFVSEVSCGNYHTIVVFENGQACGFGSNKKGQLGIGTVIKQSSPAIINSISMIVKVSSGNYHSLFLDEGGRVFSTGLNEEGQLGLGIKDQFICTPQPIDDLSHVFIQKIVAGSHSAALSDEGEVFLFGKSIIGQFEVPQKVNLQNQQIKDIDIGNQFCLALSSSNQVYSWGVNESGQLGTGDCENRNFPQLLAQLQGKKVIMINCGDNYAICLGRNKIQHQQEIKQSSDPLSALQAATPRDQQKISPTNVSHNISSNPSQLSQRQKIEQITHSNSQRSLKNEKSERSKSGIQITNEQEYQNQNQLDYSLLNSNMHQNSYQLNPQWKMPQNNQKRIAGVHCATYQPNKNQDNSFELISQLQEQERQLFLKNSIIEAQAEQIQKLQNFLSQKIAEESSASKIKERKEGNDLLKADIEQKVHAKFLEDNTRLAEECLRLQEDNNNMQQVVKRQADQIHQLMRDNEKISVIIEGLQLQVKQLEKQIESRDEIIEHQEIQLKNELESHSEEMKMANSKLSSYSRTIQSLTGVSENVKYLEEKISHRDQTILQLQQQLLQRDQNFNSQFTQNLPSRNNRSPLSRKQSLIDIPNTSSQKLIKNNHFLSTGGLLYDSQIDQNYQQVPSILKNSPNSKRLSHSPQNSSDLKPNVSFTDLKPTNQNEMAFKQQYRHQLLLGNSHQKQNSSSPISSCKNATPHTFNRNLNPSSNYTPLISSHVSPRISPSEINSKNNNLFTNYSLHQRGNNNHSNKNKQQYTPSQSVLSLTQHHPFQQTYSPLKNEDQPSPWNKEKYKQVRLNALSSILTNQ